MILEKNVRYHHLSWMITPCLWFKKNAKTEGIHCPSCRNQPENQVDLLLVCCRTVRTQVFGYSHTSGRNNFVLVTSSLWTLIESLTSLSEEKLKASWKRCAIFAQVAATIDFDPTLQASTQSGTTTSNLKNVCSIHSGLPAPCNVAQSKQRTKPTTWSDCIPGSVIHPRRTSEC